MPHLSRMISRKVALWIFALGCLLSSARLLVDTPGVNQDDDDTRRRAGQRFEKLRESLPSRGVVGYIGRSEDGPGHYYLVQYALAPLVVDHSARHAIVIGNFPNVRAAALPENLKLVRDFGDGVLLLANEDAP
ncbi:MAG TPA: hypothetical protein VFA67_07595 [Candidatus Sulfotelmatobacter sp.]|nr:hypothetical protein [Candidatus Sulfotelmatobacter sp.]